MSRIVINVGDLRATLNKLVPAVAKNSRVTLTAAEGRMEAQVHGPDMRMSAAVGYMGTGDAPPFTLPYYTLRGLLASWAKASDAEVLVDVKRDGNVNTAVTFVVGRSSATLPDTEPDPAFTFHTTDEWSMPHEITGAARIAHTMTSADEARPILTGVLIDADGTVAATDSYVLFAHESGVEAPFKMIMPREAARLLPNEPVILQVDEDRRRFGWATDDLSVFARFIDGEFPNFRQLIPSDNRPVKARVSRDELKAAAMRLETRKRAFGYSEASATWKFVPTVGLRLAAYINDGSGYAATEEVDAEVDGVDLTLGINPGFLARCLSVLATPVVEVGATDALKPLSINSERTKSLIMPVRIT